jgi:hypothetical protein
MKLFIRGILVSLGGLRANVGGENSKFLETIVEAKGHSKNQALPLTSENILATGSRMVVDKKNMVKTFIYIIWSHLHKNTYSLIII